MPFHDVRHDTTVILRVVNNKRPPRPANVGIPSVIWSLMVQCWSHQPALRPRSESATAGIILHLVSTVDDVAEHNLDHADSTSHEKTTSAGDPFAIKTPRRSSSARSSPTPLNRLKQHSALLRSSFSRHNSLNDPSPLRAAVINNDDAFVFAWEALLP
jgi:hypothetical protein